MREIPLNHLQLGADGYDGYDGLESIETPYSEKFWNDASKY